MKPYRITNRPLLLTGLGAFEAPVERRRETICAGQEYPYEWLRVDTCLAKPIVKGSEIPALRTSRDAVKFIRQAVDFGGRSREFVMVIGLDAKSRPTGVAVPHQGGLAQSIVEPAALLRPMILTNSRAMIMIHNHPSNVMDASREDVEISSRMYKAGNLVGIDLVDSIIVGDEESDGYFSMLDSGVAFT